MATLPSCKNSAPGPGSYADALTIHTNARGAARRTGDRVEATELTNFGVVDGVAGHYQQDVGGLEQALALFRETGDRD